MAKRLDFVKMSQHTTPEESPGFLLWRVSIRWRRAIEEVLRPLKLTHPQFVVLACTGWLTKEGEVANQAKIARQAGLDPNTLSQVLRGLETKGLIQRAHSTNERSKCPTLTTAGTKLLTIALPLVEKADQHFFAPVDLKKTSLLAGLHTLAETAQ